MLGWQLILLRQVRGRPAEGGLFLAQCFWGTENGVHVSVCGTKVSFEIIIAGTSLVVQWVILCAPSAGGPGSIPRWGTRSCMHAATESPRAATNIPRATTKDPTCCN